MLITKGAIASTLKIQSPVGQGTAFVIGVDEKAYIVTAAHLMMNVKTGDTIHIYLDRKWISPKITVVGRGANGIDIAVIATEWVRFPPFGLEATADLLVLGQDVYFLGFPYGYHYEAGDIGRFLPTPLVKKGIVSAMPYEGGVGSFLLDAHNNPGFSGGPVLFQPIGRAEIRIAAVVSGFQTFPGIGRIYREDDPVHPTFEHPTDLVFDYNPGILIAYSIQHALDLIRDNPCGVPIWKGGELPPLPS